MFLRRWAAVTIKPGETHFKRNDFSSEFRPVCQCRITLSLRPVFARGKWKKQRQQQRKNGAEEKRRKGEKKGGEGERERERKKGREK